MREELGQKRIRLNDSQKARLGEAAAKLGRALLAQLGTLFSPGTLLRWNRWFIARKYDGSDRRGKRGPEPKKANSIRKLVIQMATDNPSWGYGHITGELKGLGFDVHWQTVRRVMLDQGLLPDPDRPYKSTWKEFLKRHWESLAACDFFSVDACSNFIFCQVVVTTTSISAGLLPRLQNGGFKCRRNRRRFRHQEPEREIKYHPGKRRKNCRQNPDHAQAERRPAEMFRHPAANPGDHPIILRTADFHKF